MYFFVEIKSFEYFTEYDAYLYYRVQIINRKGHVLDTVAVEQIIPFLLVCVLFSRGKHEICLEFIHFHS